MPQKSYDFPNKPRSDQDTQGRLNGKVTKTLAAPTLQRMADFLDLFGVKSFDELRTPDGQINYAMFVLESGRDPEKLKKALDVCLIEGSVDVDFDVLDLRLSDEVIQDFFEQRSKTLLSRMQLS
jgi:hypothetical protein